MNEHKLKELHGPDCPDCAAKVGIKSDGRGALRRWLNRRPPKRPGRPVPRDIEAQRAEAAKLEAQADAHETKMIRSHIETRHLARMISGRGRSRGS